MSDTHFMHKTLARLEHHEFPGVPHTSFLHFFPFSVKLLISSVITFTRNPFDN